MINRHSNQRRFGVPYSGSKNLIARQIVCVLPPAEVFVDIFAGGCAVTHAAMLAGKYAKFVANDLGDAPRLFLDAINGKYKNETRWISREDFQKLKDSDPYVRLCWSFGNNQNGYMYGRNIETYKRCLWWAYVYEDLKPIRAYMPRLIPKEIKTGDKLFDFLRDYSKTRGNSNVDGLQKLQSLESFQTLRRLQSLESLGRLQSLERFTVYKKDYKDFLTALPETIKTNAVFYADPPYRGVCNSYCDKFDHAAFDDFLRSFPYPVLVSEYEMPADFVAVWEKPIPRRANQHGTDGYAMEKLFLHKRFVHNFNKLHESLFY